MRRWMWCSVAVLVTVVGVGFSTRTTLAEPPDGNSGERARELFERAARAADEGRYEEARHFADEARELFAANHEGPDGERPRPDRFAERPAGPQNDDDQGPPDGPPKRPHAAGRPGSDGPPGLDPEQRKQFQEQYQKLREMHHKMRELEQAGKTDEAKKLGEELQAARQKLEEQFPQLKHRGPAGPGAGAPGDGGPTDGKMPEMYRKMMELRKQIHDAEEAGDQKKAEELRNQAKEMMRKAMDERMRGIRGDGPPTGPEGDNAGGPRPSGRQRGFNMPPDRMGRLRMAASLLEGAGFPEDAKHVRELAKQLPKEEQAPGAGPPKGPPDGGRGPGDYRGDGRPPGPPQPRPEELKARMEKLQEQIRRLSEEVEKSQAKPDGK